MGRKVKVAVTGAAGQIGYALLFRIASGAMFGPDTTVDLNLLELEPALPALRGVVMELEDGAFPLLGKVSVFADAQEAFGDADWALLIGSVPRKAGMERGDLLRINAGVFVTQGQALARSARRSCRVLVVGNPCNTNAFVAKEFAKGLEPRNFFAMTMLDQHRASAQLAFKAGVPVGDICRMAVWGNHSATQFPDAWHAEVSGRSVTALIADEAWLRGDFLRMVQQRGAAIIQARGVSSAGSAANAIVDTVKAVETPTSAGNWFSAAVVSDGSYDIPAGLVFGYPLRTDRGGCCIVPGIDHGEFARTKISETLRELEMERDAVMEIIRKAAK